MPAFPSWRSPDVTTTATEAADIQLQLTTHLSTPKGWKAELASHRTSAHTVILGALQLHSNDDNDDDDDDDDDYYYYY